MAKCVSLGIGFSPQLQAFGSCMDTKEYGIIATDGKPPFLTSGRKVTMKDLSTIKHEDFEPCLGQGFLVKPEGANGLELELTQVKSLGNTDPAAGVRQPFSLLFRGPLEPLLSQQLYRIENAAIGELLLFLVPIGPDENGMLYNVTFN
jgi:hypothetical protein